MTDCTDARDVPNVLIDGCTNPILPISQGRERFLEMRRIEQRNQHLNDDGTTGQLCIDRRAVAAEPLLHCRRRNVLDPLSQIRLG